MAAREDRLLTIDTHHHMLPDFFWQETENAHAPVGGLSPLRWSPEVTISFMDDAAGTLAQHLAIRAKRRKPCPTRYRLCLPVILMTSLVKTIQLVAARPSTRSSRTIASSPSRTASTMAATRSIASLE